MHDTCGKLSRFFHIFFLKKLSHLNGTKHGSVYLDFNMLTSIPCLCDPVWSRSSNTDIMSITSNSAQAVTTASTWLKELRSLQFAGQRAVTQPGLTVQGKLFGGSHLVTSHMKSQPYTFVRTFLAEKCTRHDFLFFRGRKLSCTMQMSEKTNIQNPRAPVSDHSQMSLCPLQWCHPYHCNILKSLSL